MKVEQTGIAHPDSEVLALIFSQISVIVTLSLILFLSIKEPPKDFGNVIDFIVAANVF